MANGTMDLGGGRLARGIARCTMQIIGSDCGVWVRIAYAVQARKGVRIKRTWIGLKGALPSVANRAPAPCLAQQWVHHRLRARGMDD